MRRIGSTLLVAFTVVSIAVPAAAQQPIDEIAEMRLGLESSAQALAELVRQRDGLRRELDGLASKIGGLQERGGESGMLAGIELERLLRKSQKLADELTRLNRAIEQLKLARRQQVERLLKLLQKQMREELERLDLSGPDEQARVRLEAYRREIAELRARFAPKATPSPPLPTSEELLSAADTEQLKEHSQLLDDEQRRLEASLLRIDEQIADARAQLKLERQMADLLREQRLFGESDSILRATDDRVLQAPEGTRTDMGGNYDGLPAGEAPAEADSGSLHGATLLEGSQHRKLGVEDNHPAPADAATLLSRLEERRKQLVRRLERVRELRRQVNAKLRSMAGDNADR